MFKYLTLGALSAFPAFYAITDAAVKLGELISLRGQYLALADNASAMEEINRLITLCYAEAVLGVIAGIGIFGAGILAFKLSKLLANRPATLQATVEEV